MAVLRASIRAYNLDNPIRPLLMGSWRLDGLKGVVSWQGALLAYGEFGFAWIRRNRVDNLSCCEFSSPVSNVAVDNSRLYAKARFWPSHPLYAN